MKQKSLLELGGYDGDDDTPEEEAQELKRAEKVDLITIPVGIAGVNCGNCEYVNSKKNYCNNKKVLQEVNVRMCCSLWDNKGTKRAWETGDNDEDDD